MYGTWYMTIAEINYELGGVSVDIFTGHRGKINRWQLSFIIKHEQYVIVWECLSIPGDTCIVYYIS